MTYPTSYQDAEHRRALNSLLVDLQALPADEGEGAAEGGSSESSTHAGPSARGAQRDTEACPDAEVRVRSARLFSMDAPEPSVN